MRSLTSDVNHTAVFKYKHWSSTFHHCNERNTLDSIYKSNFTATWCVTVLNCLCVCVFVCVCVCVCVIIYHVLTVWLFIVYHRTNLSTHCEYDAHIFELMDLEAHVYPYMCVGMWVYIVHKISFQSQQGRVLWSFCRFMAISMSLYIKVRLLLMQNRYFAADFTKMCYIVL